MLLPQHRMRNLRISLRLRPCPEDRRSLMSVREHIGHSLYIAAVRSCMAIFYVGCSSLMEQSLVRDCHFTQPMISQLCSYHPTPKCAYFPCNVQAYNIVFESLATLGIFVRNHLLSSVLFSGYWEVCSSGLLQGSGGCCETATGSASSLGLLSLLLHPLLLLY